MEANLIERAMFFMFEHSKIPDQAKLLRDFFIRDCFIIFGKRVVVYVNAFNIATRKI